MRVGVRGVLLVLLAAAPPAVAFEFSAERTVKDRDKVVNASVKAQKDRWRFEYAEPQGGAMAAIVRADRRTAWLILSKRRVYMEVPMVPDYQLLVNEKMEGEVSREFVGREDLNGYATELFDVTVRVNGETRQYYQWVTTAQRFAIKTVSKRGDWSVEYRNLKFLKQSFRFFEPPYGYFEDRPLNSGTGS